MSPKETAAAQQNVTIRLTDEHQAHVETISARFPKGFVTRSKVLHAAIQIGLKTIVDHPEALMNAASSGEETEQ